MSTIARDSTRPIVMVAMMGYVMVLGVGLIWLHLSPLIVLGMTLGGAALLACTLHPILAIHGLLAMDNCNAALAETPVGEIAQKGMGIIIVLSWLLHMTLNPKHRLRYDRLVLAMILFVLWSALLVTISGDISSATVKALTFAQLAIGAVMFATIVDSRERLRGIYQAIVAWATLSAVIGIYQYLAGMPYAVGLIGNRNLFAMYLNVAIVCAFFLHQSSRQPLEKLCLAITVPVLLLALALTHSRGGLIVLGVAMVVVFGKAASDRRFLTLIISCILIALMAMFLPSTFWNRAGTIVPTIQKKEDTFGIRLNLWQAGMRMVADHPIRGVGPGNFNVALREYGSGDLRLTRLGAHNTYVSVAAELGLLGLALFLVLHIMALNRIRDASAAARRSGDSYAGLLALAAEACIIVIMVSGFSGHHEVKKYLWIFLGLSIAISRMREAPAGSPPEASASSASGSYLVQQQYHLGSERSSG